MPAGGWQIASCRYVLKSLALRDNEAIMTPTCFRLGIAAAMLASAVPAQEPPPESPDAQSRAGANRTKAIRVNEAIFEATGFGNAMLVATSEGAVVIDTSIAGQA